MFLVRYSIEMGWLGPVVRCVLGVLMGLILIAAGEFMRRHPLAQAAGFVKPSQVPPALTGAGVSALFVSIYAAYALYDLLPPLVAFGALGVVWVLAMLLSMLQGPFVAALGILGGFLVPILVQTGHPSAYGLFPYVLAVTGAALGVLRYMGWGWLAWGALAGAAGWPLLWLLEQPAAELGAPVIGAYLTATAALFIYVPAGLRTHNAPFTLRTMFSTIPLPAILAWSASALMLVLALLLTWADDFRVGVGGLGRPAGRLPDGCRAARRHFRCAVHRRRGHGRAGPVELGPALLARRSRYHGYPAAGACALCSDRPLLRRLVRHRRFRAAAGGRAAGPVGRPFGWRSGRYPGHNLRPHQGLRGRSDLGRVGAGAGRG